MTRPQSQSGWSSTWGPSLPVIVIYGSILLFIAIVYPFPSPFDELAHVSVVRAQLERPDFFADTRSYMLVQPGNIMQWSANANYINHPALYYLGISPLLNYEHPILALRLANVALSILALTIVLQSGTKLFGQTADRIVFAIIVASFPKSGLTGGMVTNDNLAMVAAALVFSGMTSTVGGGLTLAIGLALAGWTKLTALIALAAAAGIKILIEHKRGLFRRENWLALAGVVIGSLPYLVSFVRTGKLFHVNAAVFSSLPGTKPDWDFIDYTRAFIFELIFKWPAAEASLPISIAALLIMSPLVFAVVGLLKDARVRAVGIAYLSATLITLALHIGFGWRSFESIGDLTISQTRYYNVLWPGIALAGAVAITRLRTLRYPALLLYLTPTVIGGTVLALL